jgi:hypothetical protein
MQWPQIGAMLFLQYMMGAALLQAWPHLSDSKTGVEADANYTFVYQCIRTAET